MQPLLPRPMVGVYHGLSRVQLGARVGWGVVGEWVSGLRLVELYGLRGGLARVRASAHLCGRTPACGCRPP